MASVGQDAPLTRVLYCNAHSVINKIDELKATVSDLLPDIVCLTETWTNSDHSDAFLKINGYQIICRSDRSDTKDGCGGGLLLYAKDGFSVIDSPREAYASFNQCCGVKLPLVGGRDLELVLVYRPHKLYDDAVVSSNNDALNNIIKLTPKPSVLLGNFNFGDIDWEGSTAVNV